MLDGSAKGRKLQDTVPCSSAFPATLAVMAETSDFPRGIRIRGLKSFPLARCKEVSRLSVNSKQRSSLGLIEFLKQQGEIRADSAELFMMVGGKRLQG